MNIKSIILVATAICLLAPNSFAQPKKKGKEKEPEGYKFEKVIDLPITSIKNQSSSGTCWVFSALSYFESEIIKAGYKDSIDLSEMFVVHHAYYDKAIKYVRLHGSLGFGGGSSFGNALEVMKDYGIVPNSVMPGLNYGTDSHRHGELDALAQAYVDVIIKNHNRKLSTAWQKGFNGILDAYLGAVPETFEYDGKEFTPKTYMESLGINLDDYVDITSFTHHPFYQPMVIEVPDNWQSETAYNVPLDDLVAIMNNALENGYTVAWASDVSEEGFTRDGLGIVPDMDKLGKKMEAGSDQARWIGMNPREKTSKAFEEPCDELVITQEMRQEGYDTYQTTDDHGMHIFGTAKDQNGKIYYMVKNSWGPAGKYKGIWYVSEAFVRYKTMDILVNKNAIPQEIRTKLGL